MNTLTETAILTPQSEGVISGEKRYQYKPGIIAITGLPAAGKTTLAKILSSESNLLALDIDQTRNQIFKTHDNLKLAEERIQMKAAYEENHRRAQQALQSGQPVILVATYSSEVSHQELKKLAEESQVPLIIIYLVLGNEQEIKERLKKRSSDQLEYSNIKTLRNYLEVKSRFKPFEGMPVITINSSLPVTEIHHSALTAISKLLIPNG